MSFRSWTALVLLVIAIGAERCGYYAARSMLVIHMTRSGMSAVDAGTAYGTITMLGYAAPFIGGGLALAIGPRATAVIGGVVAALGAFLLAGGAPPVVGGLVLVIGAGVFKPCPYAAGAEILSDDSFPSQRRFAAVAAFTVVAYAAVNAGALIAPATSGLLASSRDLGLAFGFAGAMDLLAATAAGIALLVGTRVATTMAQAAHSPYRSPDVVTPPSNTPALAPPDVWGPLTLVGAGFAFMYLGMEQAHPVYGQFRDVRWLDALNPIVIGVLSIPCAILYVVLAVQRSPAPLTRVLGAGFVVFAGGLLVAIAARVTSAGISLWAVAVVLIAIGEVLASPLGLAYAALAVRGRRATMVVAGWSSLTIIPTLVIDMTLAMRTPTTGIVIAVLSALVTVAGGIAVIASAERLHRQLGAHSNATS